MSDVIKRNARKHIWKLIAVGMLLFGALVAIPVGMSNPGNAFGYFLTIGVVMAAGGVFLLAAFTDRAIRRQRRKFYGDL